MKKPQIEMTSSVLLTGSIQKKRQTGELTRTLLFISFRYINYTDNNSFSLSAVIVSIVLTASSVAFWISFSNPFN